MNKLAWVILGLTLVLEFYAGVIYIANWSQCHKGTHPAPNAVCERFK